MRRFALFAFLILSISGCSHMRPEQQSAPRRLIVAAVSMESHVRQPEQNLSAIEAWSKRAADAGADLVLLPETALSGWWANREIRTYGESIDGPAVRRLIALAKQLGIVIAFGMTERDGDHAYITHVVLDGHGILGTHRKTKLASGEERFWDPGNDANVFKVRGVSVGIAICFESVHPETCAQLKANGAEIILAPYANATDPDELLNGRRPYPAERARENQVWYVACDVPAREESRLRRGAAYFINPAGELVDITPPNAEGENMIVHTIVLDR